MKRKTKIIITFNENNLPKAKIKNATKSQIIHASMILNQYSRVPAKRKRNKLVGFFKGFAACFKSKPAQHMRVSQHIQQTVH